MEITNKLYKELFRMALKINYGDEDNAAESVNKVLTNISRFTPPEDVSEEKYLFFAWAKRIMTNTKNSIYRKEIHNPVVYTNIVPFLNLKEEDDEMDKNYLLLKKIQHSLTEEELAYMYEYISNTNKTNTDKSKFHRLKQKIYKNNGEMKKYKLTNLDSKEIHYVFTMKEATEITGVPNEQTIKYALKDNRPFNKKKWKIEKT